MNTNIYLFIQEGCRPCLYAETQLKKVKGWEDVVILTDAKEDGEWSEFAKRCGVIATPTLVAMDSITGEILAKMSGSQDMTTSFWEATISKHKPHSNSFDSLPNPVAEGIMDIYYGNFSDLDDSPFDRKCIADILEYTIRQLREHQEPGHGRFVIFCEDLWDVVDALRKESYNE